MLKFCAVAALLVAALLLSGCPGGGGGEPTPVPTATPQCPTSCEFGCRPGTSECLESPLCPGNCSFGCMPGTSTCVIPCPANCIAGCVPNTGECRLIVECPQGCGFGCVPGTADCATPAPTPSPSGTARPTPSPTPLPKDCNFDYYCDPVLGETGETCPSDCVPSSYCKYPGTGPVYDLMCKRYWLGRSGMYLEAYYQSPYGEKITVIGFKCTAEPAAQAAPASAELLPGGSAVIANGTAPCFDSSGSPFSGEPGDFFEGRLLMDYTKGSETTVFHETLSFRAAVRGVG